MYVTTFSSMDTVLCKVGEVRPQPFFYKCWDGSIWNVGRVPLDVDTINVFKRKCALGYYLASCCLALLL